MTRVLLDTSAYSALMRKRPAVLEVIDSAEVLYLSPIVLGELKAGFLLGGKREKNERDLDETADRWAIIAASLKKAGSPVASNDVWIAAGAMQHGLPILTSDRDFQKIPQVIAHRFSMDK